MLAKKTVCVLCDPDWQSFAANPGIPEQEFLTHFIHGMYLPFDILHASGINILLTCLQGYADVQLPLLILDMDNSAEVHCMLEKPGDELNLTGDAKAVWDRAHLRCYASSGDDDCPSLPQTMMWRSCCLLSAVGVPDTNPFHIAARQLGHKIYHCDAAGFFKYAQDAQSILEYVLNVFAK